VNQPSTGVIDLDSARLIPARSVASDLGIDLAPVWTNLWWLVDDGYFFDEKWHGALWASLGHLFSGGHSNAYIGAGSVKFVSHFFVWGGSGS
jgi:hypothetical protein